MAKAKAKAKASWERGKSRKDSQGLKANRAKASENLEARAVAEARIIAGAPQDSEEQANGAKEAERRRRASPLR